MKISDILHITGGILENEPQVLAIESATVFPSKVETGDLFFAARSEDIPSALEGGAYAVVFEGEIGNKADPEIAWIRVDSVREAAFRLLRYVLLKKEADFILLRPHEESFLKMLLIHKNNISFLPREWSKAFEMILNSDQHLYVGSDRELLETICPDVPRLERQTEGQMISDTLFRSTFKVEGYIYQQKEMAPFHLEHLLRIVAFCETHQLPWSMDRLRYTRHFQPVFVDGKLESVTRGHSDRVVIFTDNLKDIVLAREYIRYHSSWVKSIVLTPPGIKVENVERPHWFHSPEEAREVLKKAHFNYAFVYSLDKETLREMKDEYTLF
jgi:ferrochelatase